MSAALVALLASISVATWAYTKMQDHTGYGNSKNAIAGSAVVFVLAFIIIFSLAHLLTPN